MLKVINGIEYTSFDIGGKPVQFVVSKNMHNDSEVVHIVGNIDGVPVVRIASGAFKQSGALEELELPDSIYAIDAEAFWGCDKLRTIRFYKTSVAHSNNAVSIGAEAFYQCIALSNIETVKPLHLNGKNIFTNCHSLEKLNEGNLVLGVIWACDFLNCDKLKTIHITGKSCKLWTDCFKGLKNLESVTFDCNTVRMPESVRRILLKLKIYCSANSSIADLVYFGADVEIIN